MTKYVDICIQPVPKKHLADYRATTRKIGKLLIELGALGSSDFIADDENATKHSFPKKIKVNKGEVLIYAVAEFKSKAHRDQVFKRMEKDKRMEKIFSGPNFLDQKRAVVGGFKVLVSL
jgi:uncharacterized protein YbaA (DUF1428 family)